MLVKSIAFVCALGLLVVALAVATPAQPPSPQPVDEPEVPKGIDVQARGPVHEAFANLTAENGATPLIPKKPPTAIEEMPPAEKPEGQVAWIGGYWHWDDERQDFLWVSGCWRSQPPGRQWIAGYWREQEDKWQWVAGFWAAANTPAPAGAAVGQPPAAKPGEITYYPEPPVPPQVAPPGQPPSADTFFIPGQWVWRDGHYVWVAGYWTRVQPGYVWVASHYRWTPYGYVFVPGYWDYTLARRGLLYAPVVVDFRLVGPGFVYTPVYAVSDAVLVDAFWVRPACCHYYFGDYYGPVYRRYGFECGFVYSQRHYDAIVVYRGWEFRDNPRWHETQVNIYLARDGGRSPLPPRTLVEQRLVISQRGPNVGVTVMLAPAHRVAAERGIKVVALNREARVQEKVHAEEVHRAVEQHRIATEVAKGGAPTAPRTSSLPAAAASRQITSPASSSATNNHPATQTNSAASTAKGTTPPGSSPPAAKTGSAGPPQHPLPLNAQHSAQQKDKQHAAPPGGQKGPPPAQQQNQQHPPQQQQQSQPPAKTPPTGGGGGSGGGGGGG